MNFLEFIIKMFKLTEKRQMQTESKYLNSEKYNI